MNELSKFGENSYIDSHYLDQLWLYYTRTLMLFFNKLDQLCICKCNYSYVMQQKKYLLWCPYQCHSVRKIKLFSKNGICLYEHSCSTTTGQSGLISIKVSLWIM